MSAPAPLRMAVIHRPDAVVVIPRGDVDWHLAPVLEDALRCSADDGSGDVVVDLSDVGFMGLRGVDAIVQGAEHVADRGRQVIVRRPSRIVSLMFDVTGERDGLLVDRPPVPAEATR